MISVRRCRLITCVVNKGKARPLLEALYERGIFQANVYTARGVRADSAKRLSAPLEKEILKVVVDQDKADDVFGFLFDVGDIGRVFGSFMYMTKLTNSSSFTLPDLPKD